MKSTNPHGIRQTLSLAAPSVRLFVAVALAGAILVACDVHGGKQRDRAPARVSTIVVTPDAAVVTSSSQQMVAVGHDANGGVVTITPTWTVVAAGGTINAAGLFTAGCDHRAVQQHGSYASVGSVSGRASITVVVPGVPTPIVALGTAAPNGIMAGTAVTCVTGGIISANVSVSPGNTWSLDFGITCVITGTQHLGDGLDRTAGTDRSHRRRTTRSPVSACPPANAIVANLGGHDEASRRLLHRHRHQRVRRAHARRQW